MLSVTSLLRNGNSRLASLIYKELHLAASHYHQARSPNNRYFCSIRRFQPTKIILRSMSTGQLYTVDYLSDKLQKELQAQHIDIEDLSNCGCGMKFDAVIVSPLFEGKPILQRQRLVNQTLVEEMKHIHAFTMRTLTPDQWKEIKSKEG